MTLSATIKRLLLVAGMALVPSLAHAQGTITLVRSSPEPLPACTPATATSAEPIIWDSTAGVLKTCTALNTWTTVSGAGGGGTVTTFSSGTFLPLFTTSVLNSGTTPALSFTAATAGANTVYANCTTGTAVPAFCLVTAAMLPASVPVAVTNDTNVTGAISGQTLTLGWSGTLAKSRTLATTVYTDQANTYSAALQDMSAASFKLPSSAGAAPTTNGLLAYDTTANRLVAGLNGAAAVLPWFTSGVPANGQCAVWSGTAGLLTASSCGGGTVASAQQFALPYYSGSGVANAIAGLAAPTGPNGVAQVAKWIPSGGVATAPTIGPGGVSTRSVTIATDAIAATDRGNRVSYTSASPTTVSIAQAGTTGFDQGFVAALKNASPVTVTLTPTTSTVDGFATLLIPSGVTCFLYLSATGTNYESGCLNGGSGGSGVNNLQTLGPNPWYDLSRYGLYTGSGAAITCSTTAASTTVTCPSGTGDFAVGHGIEIPGAGPASTFPPWGVTAITNYARTSNVAQLRFQGPTFGAGQTITVAGLADTSFNGTYTVTANDGQFNHITMPNSGPNVAPTAGSGTATLTSPQVVVFPQGILNGTTTWSYQVVMRGYNGELSAASSAGTTTTGAATLGLNTATVTSCTRSGGVATCTTSAAHNFQAGVLTDVENVSDTTFRGEHLIISTPTSTTFTFNQSYANSSGSGGTAQVVAKNMVRWNMMATYNIQAIVYRSKNGGAYSIAGVVEGMDGAFADWGLSAPLIPSNVPATPPGSPANGILATTISAISGTTLTVAAAATASVASASSQHDNSPVMIAGCTALGTNGTGTLYIPASNPPASVPFNSPLDMLHNCSSVQQVNIAIASTLLVNDPIILKRNGMAFKGVSPTGAAPTFGISPSTQVIGAAYPFFYLISGTFGPTLFENLNMQVNHSYQSAVVEDSDNGGGNVVSVQYNNDYFTGGNGGEMPFIARGGFNMYFDKGVFNSAGVWGVPEIMEFTVPNSLGSCPCSPPNYIIKLDQMTFTGHGIQWDDWGIGTSSIAGYMTLNDTLYESAYSPLLTINLSNSVITGIEMNRTVLADTSIGGSTAGIISKSGLSEFQSNDTLCGNGPLFEGVVATGVKIIQGASNSCSQIGVSGIALTNLQGSGSYQAYYNFPVLLAGTSSVYYQMDPPLAPTLVVSAGGLVPVSATMCFAISALDINGGETIPGPAACTTTTSGQQTVTITRPTLPTGATGWYVYWNQGIPGNSFSRVPAFVLGAGALSYVHAASFGNGNSALSTTTAGKSSIGPGGLGGNLTSNQVNLIAGTLTTPPGGQGGLGIDSGTGLLTCQYNGLSCLNTSRLLVDNGTTLSYSGSGGFYLLSDGVHAGYSSLLGNTATQAVVTNTAGWMGPNSAAFTGYALQLPATAPSGTQNLICTAPVSAVSTCSFSNSNNVQIVPLTSAANTIAPTANAVVGLTVKCTSGTGNPDCFDVQNSSAANLFQVDPFGNTTIFGVLTVGSVTHLKGDLENNFAEIISLTAPTIAAGGCGGAAASIASNNGTAAFTINVGTTPTSGGCTVTMPAAALGWACHVSDLTTTSSSVFLQKKTSGTTTSLVLQNFNTSAVATAPVASDIYEVQCLGR